MVQEERIVFASFSSKLRSWMAKPNLRYTNRAVKGTALFFIMSLLAGFLGYLVRLVLARELSKAEYGIFYGVFTLFAFLSLFRDMGLGPALTKYLPEFEVKKRMDLAKGAIIFTFAAQFILAVIISSVTFFWAEQIAFSFFHNSLAMLPLKLLSMMFLLIQFEKIYSFIFTGFQKIRYISMIEFTRMICVLTFIVIAFKFGAALWIPAAGYLFAYGFETVFFYPFFRRAFPSFWKVSALIDYKLMRKMAFFSMPVMLGLFGSMVLTYTDTLMLSYLRTAEDVALYQVAMPTTKLLLYFSGALGIVLLPLSSELWARRLREKLAKGMDMLYRYSFAFIFPLALALICFPGLALTVLFGKQYAEAALALQLLAVGTFLFSISTINSNVLAGIGKPSENSRYIIIGAVSNVVMNAILIPMPGRFGGVVGASIATVISYALILGGTSVSLGKAVKVNVPWGGWLKTCAAGAAFVLVVFLVKSRLSMFSDIPEAVMTAAAGGIVYLLLLFAFRVIRIDEIKYLLGAVISRKRG